MSKSIYMYSYRYLQVKLYYNLKPSLSRENHKKSELF